MATVKSETKFIPFAQREEWKDITPIKQDDGPNPVCAIAYAPKFSETMDYFRAILQKDERTERAFNLTTEVLDLNPANYTAWYFRRLLLDSLKLDIHKELEYITEAGSDNPKNYQIWYHRRWCVEKLGEFAQELAFTAEQIEEDSKNYHAWAHRQFVIEAQGSWDSELDYIESLLKADPRNNSAWNQRFFVISKNTNSAIFSAELIAREANYAISYIKKAPNNQSPWTYLKGLFNKQKFSVMPNLKEMCLEFKEKYITSPHPASLLVDIYEQENSKEEIPKAIELCDELANSLDQIHKKYWDYKKTLLHENLAKL